MAKKYPHLGQRLKKLLFDRNMKPVDLARELDLPQPTIHRIVSGKSTRPYKSSLEPIAQYFNVSVDQLLGEEPAPQDLSTLTSSSQVKVVPLVTWQAIGFKNKKAEPLSELVVGNVSDEAFAVHMPDYSMEPLFQKGATLIFDPKVVPADRSYVLIQLENTNTVVFRQLLVDADHRFIKSLNVDISAASMRLLNPEDQILGCLVETRSNFQSNALT